MKTELERLVKILKNGGTIIYPTDTVWGIGCDATNEIAVEKVYRLKDRKESKSLIILVDSWEMLENYISRIPRKVNCILHGSSKPTSVIYSNPKGLAKNVIAQDNTVAIRIVKDDFCKDLIKALGKPIVSTSANYSGVKTPKSYDEIDESLLLKADYVVSLNRDNRPSMASQIVKVDSKGNIKFLRK